MEKQWSRLEELITSSMQTTLRGPTSEIASASAIAQQLTQEISSCARVDDEGRSYAPDQYTISLNPLDFDYLRQKAPQAHRHLSAALLKALNGSSLSFLKNPQVTLATEFLFYWLHRYVHYNRGIYYWLHIDHHRWRHNSFALVNHDLAIPEIAIFSLCPAIPCIALGVHWKTMLLHAIYTNWQGTYSHSGYHSKCLDIALLTDSRDHDNHHKHPTFNFAGGGWFSLMDRVFGTHYPVEGRRVDASSHRD